MTFTKRISFKVFLLCAYSVLCINLTYSQLEITTGITPEELAGDLVGSGVTISDVVLDCGDGAFGTFNCIDCNVGIDSGIVLTSGGADVTVGPNNSGSAGVAVGTPGDADLEALFGETYNDACSLEFNVTVTSDSLKFDYVFGSEEYLEYVFSFNDGFAFFISGPGIVGTENIALVPGTSTPVSIDNINTTVNPMYYVDNGDGFSPPYSTDPYYIQYDGFTTVLTAYSAVIPCETYHLKLVVADALDAVLDSGVFIKAQSLSSPGVTIKAETDLDGYPYLIEGCINGSLTLDLSYAPIDTFTFALNLGGTATNGLDFTTLPDSITFYPGDTTITIPFEVFADGLTEGIETIIFSVDIGCAVGMGDSLVIQINDAIPMTVSSDTLICPGGTATLSATGAETYEWSPSETVSNPNDSITTASPTESTTYSVTGTLASCTNTLSTTVNIQEQMPDAGNDTTIYAGESAFLNGSGGVSYSWVPAASLDNPNSETPVATPSETTTYTVTVTSDIGCVSTDTVTVFLSEHALIAFPNAFSPNGDGINDFFFFVSRGEIASFNLTIYNRWGEIIFNTNSLDAKWDGTYNNKEQPMGSYAYVMHASDVGGKLYDFKGNVTLVK